MLERGLSIDHTTMFRWVQQYAPELEKCCRPHLKACTNSWKVDETYIKVKSVWMYLYRAVDSEGNTLEFLLRPKRDAEAAKDFLVKALGEEMPFARFSMDTVVSQMHGRISPFHCRCHLLKKQLLILYPDKPRSEEIERPDFVT
jgi:transposase-like protein